MKRPLFKLLERVFSAEINGRIYQPARESKILLQALEDGYVRRTKIVIPGRFPVTCEGFALTPKGHYSFCDACR